MQLARYTENNYTVAERAIYDAMVGAVRVKHESFRTGQIVPFPGSSSSAVTVPLSAFA